MKKGFLVVLALAIAFSSAVAQEKVTLNVLNYQQADQAGYQEDVAIWQRFQQQNPDITLNIEVLFSEPYHQKLQVYAAAGTLPDVFYVWPTARSAVIHEKKLAKDLAQLLGADFLKDFSGAAINPNNQLGKYMAMLPQSFTYTSVMYVNKNFSQTTASTCRRPTKTSRRWCRSSRPRASTSSCCRTRMAGQCSPVSFLQCLGAWRGIRLWTQS